MGAQTTEAGPSKVRWSNPSFFSAIPSSEKDFYVTPGFRYGEYKGRKAELKEVGVGGYVSDQVELWYTHLDILLKGQTVARFRSDADTYGARWYFKPSNVDQMAMAAEVQYTNTSTGRVDAGSSSGLFQGPTSVSLRLLGTNPRGTDFIAGYTRINIGSTASSNVFELGAGKDLNLSDRLVLRLQGSLIGENLSRPADSIGFEFRPVAVAALGYKVAKNAQIDFDITGMPFGTPLAYGQDTGFTIFQLHNITGPAAGIRSDPFALASLRLLYRVTY